MGDYADIYNKLTGEGQVQPAPETVGSLEDAQPGILSQAAHGLLSLGSGALKAINYPAELLRAAAGRLEGIQGTGPSTILGPAPSGRELLGAGPGIKGKFEAADIPGFALEMGADPLLFANIGSLTKGGQLLKRAASLEETGTAALKIATGKGDVAGIEAANNLLGTAAQLSQQADALGAGAKYGATLREQIASGQRSLLSIHPKTVFSEDNIPLTGRMGQIPFAGLDAVGNVAKTATEPIAKLFRIEGETGNAVYDAMRTEAERDALRQTRVGAETASFIDKLVGAIDPAQASLDLEKVQAAVKPVVPTDSYTIRRIDSAMEKADAAGDMRRVAILGLQRDKAARELDPLLGTNAVPAGKALVNLALEYRDVPERAGLAIKALNDQYTLSSNTRLLAAQQRDIANGTAIMGLDGKFLTGTEFAKAEATNRYHATILADKVLEKAQGKKTAETLLANLPDWLKTPVDRGAQVLDTDLVGSRMAGIRVSELKGWRTSYMPHVFTPEGLRAIEQMSQQDPGGIAGRLYRQFQTRQGFTIERGSELEGLGVMNANEFLRQKAAELGVKMDGDFFVLDPAEIFMRRMGASSKARLAANLAYGVAETFRVPGSIAKAGDVSMPRFLQQTGLLHIGGKELPEEEAKIAEALRGTIYHNTYVDGKFARATTEMVQSFNSPKELTKLRGFIQGINATARFYATVPFPGFHVRNAFSDGMMMWQAGMRSGKIYGEGWTTMFAARKALQKGAAASSEEKAALSLVRRAMDSGGLQHTFTAETMEELGQSRFAAKSKGALDLLIAPKNTKIGRTMLDASALRENIGKMALWLDGVRNKGLSDIESSERVRKWLFDYGAISKFEKENIRKWAFFWTYQRKAIPLILGDLAKTPGKYSGLSRALGYASGSEQSQLLNPQQQAQGYFNAGRWGGKGVFAGLDLPINLLTSFEPGAAMGVSAFARSGQKVLGQLAPTIKFPIEAFGKINLSSGQPSTPLEAFKHNVPFGRFISTRQQVADVGAGKKTLGDLLANLGGVNVVRSDPQQASVLRSLERVRALKDLLADTGRARRSVDVVNLAGQKSSTLHALDSLEARLRRQLAPGR
jgi:hypothetical protein